MSLRERLDTLSRGELAGLIVVIVATLAGVGFWYSRSLPKPIQIAETPAPAVAASASASGSVSVAAGASETPGAASSPAAQLIVDVAGWVRRPGVYQFDPGARVVDAVERAGGAREGADLTLLNLAAPLVDGQQILVPKKGDAVAVGGTGTTVTGPGGLPVVNINTADETTLETLNGVGPSLATAIIQYRTEHGPFTSVDQLDQVSGIGPATLEKLRPQVTV
jgi:competence protein ComEA